MILRDLRNVLSIDCEIEMRMVAYVKNIPIRHKEEYDNICQISDDFDCFRIRQMDVLESGLIIDIEPPKETDIDYKEVFDNE